MLKRALGHTSNTNLPTSWLCRLRLPGSCFLSNGLTWMQQNLNFLGCDLREAANKGLKTAPCWSKWLSWRWQSICTLHVFVVHYKSQGLFHISIFSPWLQCSLPAWVDSVSGSTFSVNKSSRRPSLPTPLVFFFLCSQPFPSQPSD